MLRIGLFFISIGIIWYIIHTVIYNYFLRKHHADIYDDGLRSRHASKQSNKVTVIVTSGQTPVWIVLFGIPPIPLFLLGIVITILGLIINIFQSA